jgi:dTDP-4-dehydrorhamnose 3,5-epimerase-like enzyme
MTGAFRIVLLQTISPYEALSFWWREGAEGALHIPAGLAHGYRVEGTGEGRMLYLTSETYSPQDEGRLEWDQHVEGFPWNERPETGV